MLRNIIRRYNSSSYSSNKLVLNCRNININSNNNNVCLNRFSFNNSNNILANNISHQYLLYSSYSTTNTTFNNNNNNKKDDINNNSSNVSLFGFDKYIENELKNQFNVLEATEIQKKTIKPLLSGKDLFIVDETGTGKSFLLMSSIVNDYLRNYKLINKQSKQQSQYLSPNYIIVTPNRELAWQYGDWIRKLTANIGSEQQQPAVAMVVGGQSLSSIYQQLKEIQPNIIIGTPNYIYELLVAERLSIDSLRMLVVDEADLIMQAMSRNSTFREKQNRKKHLPEGVKLIIEINKRARSRMDFPTSTHQQQSSSSTKDDKKQQPTKQQQPLITDKSILSLINPLNKNTRQQQQRKVREVEDVDEEVKHIYQRTVRWFQTIYASATLNLRNRKYIDEKDWINEDRVYVTLMSKQKEDLAVPQQFTNRFVPVVSEQGLLNALVSKWIEFQPTKAIGVIPNDGSVDKVVQSLRERGINARPLNEFMDFETFNITGIKDQEKRQYFKDQIASERKAKEHTVAKERKERSKQQHGKQQQQQQPTIMEEDEIEIVKLPNMNDQQILYIGKENAIRGVDISSIGHVFILNITLTMSSYLHMAGRSGRMGQKGHVISIYNALLSRKYEGVMKLLNTPFQEDT
ncbi:hypothetical protein PPL_12150 [Heterostelium album PN500]|uniref:ATP-dependent RNA helicase n=1 Tax=Heterostelium pallidum (strain ATCC 26659 / Pp 5 / PN500) TaxID=670386 RepID=D3BLU6_HETP5|nr:hypothetical protein PPL_12150 [Heterostelium album PN500]EFA77547.1 hypothetical protein PPL_12150 [Heterostelium album PN500]|eukprot:XP_020429675.1 hypothetical protein PPL_12150 [Heterostelium album PN500]